MKPYPAYKDSGIAWIGEVPEHWIDKRLKYSLMLITDKDVDDSTTKIALENIESWTGKYLETSTEFAGDGVAFKRDDLLFGKLRPYLAKVWQAEFDGNAVGDIFVYRANKAIVPRFAFYRFISRDFIDIVNGSTFGAKMPRASSEFIGNLTFAYPPPAEQTAIAAYLDRKTAQIDTLIERKRRLIQLLQEERTALISQAVTKGLNPTAKMKDSGIEWIGEVPEGWEVKKIKYLGKIISGYSFKSDEFKNFDTGCRVLKISNIQTMRMDWTDESFIDESYYHQLPAYRLYQGDLVFALTRPIISTGIKAAIIQSEGKILINQRNAVFRASNKLMVSWMYYILFSAEFVEHFESLIDSTGQQPNISAIDIGNISIPMPPDEEQTAIAAYLDEKTAQIDQTITRTEQQIELLQEYRTALISAAVTGKIDVREEVVL